MSKQQARVGVGVLVMREGDGKILVGKRFVIITRPYMYSYNIYIIYVYYVEKEV